MSRPFACQNALTEFASTCIRLGATYWVFLTDERVRRRPAVELRIKRVCVRGDGAEASAYHDQCDECLQKTGCDSKRAWIAESTGTTRAKRWSHRDFAVSVYMPTMRFG